jgi:hyperosmotically inducible periplasmic protein
MNRFINTVGLTLSIVLATLLLGCDRTPEQERQMDSMKESMGNSADKMKESASEATGNMKESMGEMQDSADQYLDDAVITAQVKEKLVSDQTTKAYQISVETLNGTVQLSGFVQSADEKSQAGEIAAGVTGVKSVKNDLILKSKTEGRNDNGKIRVA